MLFQILSTETVNQQRVYQTMQPGPLYLTPTAVQNDSVLYPHDLHAMITILTVT